MVKTRSKGRKGFKRGFKRFRKINKKVSHVHFFKRSMVNTIDVTDDNYQAVNHYSTHHNNFSLSQLPSYNDYTGLYDSFKICGIKMKFIFDANINEIGGQGLPTLATVNDYNDSTVLTEATMMQYSSFKATRLNKPIVRYFKPTMAVSGTNQIVKARWLPTDAYQTPHYGLKSAVIGSDASPTSATIGRLKIYTTFYLAMRTPK